MSLQCRSCAALLPLLLFACVAAGQEKANVRPKYVENKDGSSPASGAFSPDGSTFYVAHSSGVVSRFDPATGKAGEPLGEKQVGGLRALAVSHDGKLIATGGKNKRITLIDAKTGKEVRSWEAHQDPADPWFKEIGVICLSFSPDGKTLASGGWDKAVNVWDVATGKQVKSLTAHKAHVASVEFSPDGKALLTALSGIVGVPDGRVILYSVSKWTPMVTIQSDLSMLHHARFSPDGSLVATTGGGGALRVWNAATGKLKWKAEPQFKGQVGYSLAFDPSGKVLAHGVFDGQGGRTEVEGGSVHSPDLLKLWDVKSGEPLWAFNKKANPDNSMHWLEFSPDGKQLVSLGGSAHRLVIWDVAYWTKSK